VDLSKVKAGDRVTVLVAGSEYTARAFQEITDKVVAGALGVPLGSWYLSELESAGKVLIATEHNTQKVVAVGNEAFMKALREETQEF
jgi:hypothetical protein